MLLVEDGVKHLIYQRMGRNISSIRVFPFSPVSLSFVQEIFIAAKQVVIISLDPVY